jgi:hypothetical protein
MRSSVTWPASSRRSATRTSSSSGRRLADAVEPSLRLRLIDLLSEAALSLNSQLDIGHVEVRMAGARSRARLRRRASDARGGRRPPAMT